MDRTGAAFVKVTKLTKRFGDLIAVDDVSFAVEQGHTLALLGPSGCGKTTILRCLAGLETADAGAIEIAGTPVFDRLAGIDLVPERRALGIVFQSYAVWPHMTVADNVGFPLKVRGAKPAEKRDRVGRMLDLVGLGAVHDKPATALSGGQQQRVALARALVHEPRLVLFDEPMSNLDAQLREQMRMELKVLQGRLGFTAIYVTHDQAEAFALAETVVVMNRGHIETVGPPRVVFHRPPTPFVARFLGLNVCAGVVVATAPQPDGSLRAEVALGERWRVHGIARPAQEIGPGTRVLVCVRKERVGLRKVEAVRNSEPPCGEVRAVSFLGLDEEYGITVAGVELRAIQPYQEIHAGDCVEVTIRPQDCIVLREA